MKKLFLTFVMLLICLATMAREIDGIYYNLNDVWGTAEVTRNPYGNGYSGSVTIPSSVRYNSKTYDVTSIGERAFEDCAGLTSVTIGKYVTRIDTYAFAGCTGLTSITIRYNVTSIGSSAFSGCTELTNIKVEYGNTVYDSRNNCNAIIETATNTLVFGCKGTIIPNSVTSIGYKAFETCKGLTSITIPESVTEIGDYAFYYCSGLKNITIVNSSSRKYIGRYCFSECSNIENIYSYCETPPDLMGNSFDSYFATVYVPKASVERYKNEYEWERFGKIEPISGTAIEDINVDGVATQPVKVTEEGRVVILMPDGRKFDTNGRALGK